MISKLVDLVLKLAEMRFDATPVLVRDLKALHDALEDCHKKYLAIGAIPIDDEASRKAAELEHRNATSRLMKALNGFEELFTIHAPEGTWNQLTSYAALEAQGHPRPQFQRIVEVFLEDNELGDYETAIKTLRGYIRDNIKPEEIHGGV